MEVVGIEREPKGRWLRVRGSRKRPVVGEWRRLILRDVRFKFGIRRARGVMLTHRVTVVGGARRGKSTQEVLFEPSEFEGKALGRGSLLC